jgi:glycosyltransferase involved in cell wall biosynthesis
MIIGGSTTSLLSILNKLDYTSYEVDLLLYYNKGALYDQIPHQVTILAQASIYPQSAKAIKFIRSVFKGDIMRALYCGLVFERQLKLYGQTMVYARLTNSRYIEKEYDIAIGFLEGWPNLQVALKINARKKIMWIHPDYKESSMNPLIDYKIFKKADNIVTVSKKGLENLIEVFPEFKSKIKHIENILSKETLVMLAQEFNPDFNVNESKINLITICRIDFASKGLDRGVEAFLKLKVSNLVNNYHWYIIGDGRNYNELSAIIKDYDLEKHITLLGQKKNPFPYLIKMDMFFLPSRYEGKPMAVTEAQILGIPALITAYSSAYEQINDGYNGIIVQNSDIEIYNKLKNLVNKKEYILELKKNTSSNQYSDDSEMIELYKIFE